MGCDDDAGINACCDLLLNQSWWMNDMAHSYPLTNRQITTSSFIPVFFFHFEHFWTIAFHLRNLTNSEDVKAANSLDRPFHGPNLFLGPFYGTKKRRWNTICTTFKDVHVDHDRSPGEKDSSEWTDALGRVFLAVFVAEWGDRTQAPDRMDDLVTGWFVTFEDDLRLANTGRCTRTHYIIYTYYIYILYIHIHICNIYIYICMYVCNVMLCNVM